MSDRATDGKFVKGNRGGPGRPRREVEQEYRNATLGKVPLTRWRKIVARAVDDAEVGDAKARSWLTDLLGLRPPQRIAETTSDGDDMTLGKFLALAAERSEAGPPSNVINVDEEYADLVARAEAEAAVAQARAAGAQADEDQDAGELPSGTDAIEIAADATVTYSAGDDDAKAE